MISVNAKIVPALILVSVGHRSMYAAIDKHLMLYYRHEAVMQSAVANGKLDGQSVHALYSATATTTTMWNSACNDESNGTSAAAADCRAIVPMLSGNLSH